MYIENESVETFDPFGVVHSMYIVFYKHITPSG